MRLSACFLVLFATSVCGYDDVTLAEYFEKHQYIFLRGLIHQTGLTGTLSNTGPLTVFAPTDTAFATLGQDTLNAYSDAQHRSILELHIVHGYILAPMVTQPTNYTTLLGETILVEPWQGSLLVNGKAQVTGSNDIIVRNGVIQPLNKVLLPPLEYLITENIAQILLMDETRFNDVFLALLLADLVDLLQTGDFTMFAPVDAAFVQYKDNLLNPDGPNAQTVYQEVLKYHVVPGGRKSNQLQNGNLFTLHGTAVVINTHGNAITVNGANVIEADIFAANGFIHAIDTLLIPHDLAQIAQG